MKKIAIILAAAAIAVTLCACGGDSGNKTSSAESKTESSAQASADESSTESKTESGSSDKTDSSAFKTAFEKVKAEAKLPSDMSDFTLARLKRNFGIEADDVDDFAGAVCTEGKDQTEIIIIKAKDETAAGKIKEKLENERQSKINVTKNYNPDQLQMIENASVETDGLTVYLVLAEDADNIVKIFKANA